MDRPRLIPQIYGYMVCLVCVITMLVASGGIIDGVFDSGRPELSRDVDPSLRTFDAYKQSRIDRVSRRANQGPVVVDINLPPRRLARTEGV